MHSRLLVPGLPRSLPSLPHSPAPPCLPCVERRQRAAPHSSEFPSTSAPVKTLHMEADVSNVLIPWIRATRRQLRDWFSRDLPFLRLHSDKGETLPTLRWMGQAGDASVFLVWGTLSLVRNTTPSKLSPCTLHCVFLGFPTDAPPWQLHLHASHPAPLAPLFPSTSPPPQVDPLPPQGPAPSGLSQVDPPPLVEPLEISYDSFGPAEGGDPATDDT
ncbi:unnamed protein product, partial [Closterium sp. NIES-53]